jgi:hypothetical protein
MVPRHLLSQRFLSNTNKSFSERKADDKSSDNATKSPWEEKLSSDSARTGTSSNEKSFGKSSTKSQTKKDDDTNRSSGASFDTSEKTDKGQKSKLTGDDRSSQQMNRNPLQTQRSFSTLAMILNSNPASVRRMSEDSKRGMDKKEDECGSCDDKNTLDKDKRGESSTKSWNSDSTQSSQDKWSGSAKVESKSQDMNKDKTMSNQSGGTGFSDADKRSEAKDKTMSNRSSDTDKSSESKGQNKDSRLS